MLGYFVIAIATGFFAGIALRPAIAAATPVLVCSGVANIQSKSAAPWEDWGAPWWLAPLIGAILGASGLPGVLLGYVIQRRRADRVRH